MTAAMAARRRTRAEHVEDATWAVLIVAALVVAAWGFLVLLGAVWGGAL